MKAVDSSYHKAIRFPIKVMAWECFMAHIIGEKDPEGAKQKRKVDKEYSTKGKNKKSQTVVSSRLPPFMAINL